MKGTIRERRNRDGSVSWLCQIEIGRDPVTGQRRYKSKVAGSKREAHCVVHALVAEAGTQRSSGEVVPTAMTVAELIERWLELAGPSAPSTRSVYAGYIKNQIRPYVGGIAVGELKVTDLDRWYTALDRAGLAPASIRKAHNIVRGALTQGVRWGWLTANVAALARPPAVPRSVIPTPRASDVRDLVALVTGWDPEFATFLRLAGVTGCRPGEMCALRWDDIDFVAGDLHVRRRIMREGGRMFPEDLTKTGKVRRIPLDRSTLGRLREHRDIAADRAEQCGVRLPAGGYVFTLTVDGSTHWRPDVASRKFTTYRKRAGWDAATLYSLRHQAATTMIDAGVDAKTASDRLGNSVATILSTYTRGRTEADIAAANMLGSLYD